MASQLPLGVTMELITVDCSNQIGAGSGEITQFQIGFADLVVQFGEGLWPSGRTIDIKGIEQQGEGQIGIIGLPKGFTVLMGGNGGVKPRLGNEVAQGLNQEEVLALVDRIVAYYKTNANKNERLGRMIDRLGLETVQGAIL